MCRPGSFPSNGVCKSVGTEYDFILEVHFEILNIRDNVNFTLLFEAFYLNLENEILSSCDIRKCEATIYKENATYYILSTQMIRFPCRLDSVLTIYNNIKDRVIFLEVEGADNLMAIKLHTSRSHPKISLVYEFVFSQYYESFCFNMHAVKIDLYILEECPRIQVLKSNISSFHGVFDNLFNKSLSKQHIVGHEDIMLTVCLSDYTLVMATSNLSLNLKLELHVVVVVLTVYLVNRATNIT